MFASHDFWLLTTLLRQNHQLGLPITQAYKIKLINLTDLAELTTNDIIRAALTSETVVASAVLRSFVDDTIGRNWTQLASIYRRRKTQRSCLESAFARTFWRGRLFIETTAASLNGRARETPSGERRLLGRCCLPACWTHTTEQPAPPSSGRAALPVTRFPAKLG